MFVGGDKIEGGHYTVVKELGQGGMGMVYHCHDEALQRDVAIKMLLPELTTNKDTLDGFIQEARLAAQLEHPNVVTIYEIGKEERQNRAHHYIAMEYLTGGNLASRINGKQLSIEHCLSWMKQLANGLAYAHKRGIVHQDIKADNIFITTEGDLKIGDFGLARLAAGRAKGRSGHHGMGTPAYMSPELCRGDPQDHRSDIYSMGILFYEMATGQLPFKARGMIEMAMKHASAPIPSSRKLNPQVPEALDKVIQKMMAKQPGERYQTMAEVVGILDDLIFELRVARLGLGPKASASSKGGSGFFKPRADSGDAQLEQQVDRPVALPEDEPDTPSEPRSAFMPPAAQAFSQTAQAEEKIKQPHVEERPGPPLTEKARILEESAKESPLAEPSAPAATPKRHLELLWAFHSFGPIGWRATPSASKEGTVIYCGSSDGTFYALDAQAGSKLWTFETRGPVLSSGLVKLDRIMVSSMDGHLYALSSRTGSLIWKTDLNGPIASPAVFHEETLIAGVMNGDVVAVSAKDGKVLWRYKTGDAVVSSAEIVNPTVFIASKDEYIYAISLASGAAKWKFKTSGAIVSGAIASVDSVYVASTDGSLYALDLENGRLVWQYETIRPIVSRPVIHFTTVLFCSQDKWLYCCEKYDGHLLWKAAVRGRVVANTVSNEGRIYLATREGWVQCFDARSGELVWQMDTKRRLEAAPLVSNDVLYLGTVDGDVLAYSLADSAGLRSA